MNQMFVPRVIIITPTTGDPTLFDAIKSVQRQSFKELLHLVVLDGECFVSETIISLQKSNSSRLKIIILPFNTGANGFNGHRIYAALPYLINSEYVLFLDQDNWFDENHVGSLISLIEKTELDWAYSLRKIVSHKGKFIANDDCESIGDWLPFSGRKHLVDTSCYAVRGDFLKSICHVWYHPLGADRHFFDVISEASSKYQCTGLYSLNYRLHELRPPTAEYFKQGNLIMSKRYKELPWSKLK